MASSVRLLAPSLLRGAGHLRRHNYKLGPDRRGNRRKRAPERSWGLGVAKATGPRRPARAAGWGGGRAARVAAESREDPASAPRPSALSRWQTTGGTVDDARRRPPPGRGRSRPRATRGRRVTSGASPHTARRTLARPACLSMAPTAPSRHRATGASGLAEASTASAGLPFTKPRCARHGDPDLAGEEEPTARRRQMVLVDSEAGSEAGGTRNGRRRRS